ncbi:S1C family serine protease [Fodinibius roseus]|nr:trypsin-like peptidase domain-containing protein [Fodinibius roseus]
MKHPVYSTFLFLFLLMSASCTNAPRQSDALLQQREPVTQEAGTTISSLQSSSAASASDEEEGEAGQSVSVPQSTSSSIDNSRQTAITRAVRNVSPAVVSITVTEVVQKGRRVGFDQYYNRFFFAPIEREVNSMGSGFIISQDGLVVTNQHVAGTNAKKVVISLPDGEQYDAEVLGTDELADITLLKMEADRTFPTVEFGNSDNVIVGEWSLAVGNPFGLFESAQPSVTVGVVSATNRDFRPNPNEPRVYVDMIQTDAAINRGNSGGPLVDSEGKVIGINTFIFTGGTSRGFVGLGFAIPSNRVQKIIRQLVSSGEVQLPFDPGFTTVEMTYELMAKYNLRGFPGLLLVQSVNRDGPAYEAGIMPGDIILRIGDERVQSKMHAQALFREYTEGDSMRVELYRKGSHYETKMYLRKKVKE